MMKTLFFIYASLLASTLISPGQTVGAEAKALTGKFLHVTDIHVDPNYLEGSNPKKLCHRKSKKNHKNTAGKFGALHTDCDSPISLVDASFEFMKQSLQDIDFIIYTGDTARHDRDKEMKRTSSDVLGDHKMVVDYFKKTYDVSSIKLIPTIGNNDAVEHNDLTPKSTIYKSLESIWKPFNLNLGDSFQDGGYFIQDDLVPGLRVINVNSMFFFKKNDDVKGCDHSGSPGAIQLDWMKKSLQAAKNDNVMVYVMGHVPPNDDDGSKLFTSSCFDQYYQLLGEYGDIIAGHFTGHTNNDMLTAVVPDGKSFNAVPAVADKKSLAKLNVGNVATMLFNAPSIIPVNNPAIRVYEYETGKGREHPVGTILDWKQYYADLDKANKEGNVKYELEYQASKLYGVNKFDAQGIARAFKEIRLNSKVRQEYSEYVTVSRP